MRLITLKSETDVGALADRLYTDLTPASRKLAVAALLKANPQLANPGGFKTGGVVNLPDLPDVKPRPGAAGSDPGADLVSSLQASVQDFGDRLAKALDIAAGDVRDQIALLRQKDVAAAIKLDPNAAKIAKSLTSSLGDRAKAIADEKKQLPVLLKQIAASVDSQA